MATSIVDILYFWSNYSESSMALGREISSLSFPIKKICVDNKEIRSILKNNKKIKISNVPALCLILSNKNIVPLEGTDMIIDWVRKSGIPVNPQANIQFEPIAKSSHTKNKKSKKKKVSFDEKAKKKSSIKKSKMSSSESFEDLGEQSSNSDIEFIQNDEPDMNSRRVMRPMIPQQKPDKKRALMDNIFSMAQQMAEESKETYGYNEEELPKYH